METETETRTAELREPRYHTDALAELALCAGGNTTTVVEVDREQLQAIVQQAWDQHGICADPFASETDWLDGMGDVPTFDELDAPLIVEHRDGHVLHRTAEFTHAAHNIGARA